MEFRGATKDWSHEMESFVCCRGNCHPEVRSARKQCRCLQSVAQSQYPSPIGLNGMIPHAAAPVLSGVVGGENSPTLSIAELATTNRVCVSNTGDIDRSMDFQSLHAEEDPIE